MTEPSINMKIKNKTLTIESFDSICIATSSIFEYPRINKMEPIPDNPFVKIAKRKNIIELINRNMNDFYINFVSL